MTNKLKLSVSLFFFAIMVGFFGFANVAEATHGDTRVLDLHVKTDNYTLKNDQLNGGFLMGVSMENGDLGDKISLIKLQPNLFVEYPLTSEYTHEKKYDVEVKDVMRNAHRWLYLCGNIKSTVEKTTKGFIMKLDENGNFLWFKVYREMESINSMACDGSRMLAVGDYLYTDFPGKWTMGTILGLNAGDGSVMWNTTVWSHNMFSGESTELNQIIRVNDGNFAYVGTASLSKAQGGPTGEPADIMLGVINPSVGTIVYEKVVGSQCDENQCYNEFGNSILYDKEKRAIVITGARKVRINKQDDPKLVTWHPYIMSFDEKLGFTWYFEYRIGNKEYYGATATKIEMFKKSEYQICGNIVNSPHFGRVDAFVLRVKNDGSPFDTRINGSSDSDYFHGMAVIPGTDRTITAGYSNSFPASPSPYNRVYVAETFTPYEPACFDSNPETRRAVIKFNEMAVRKQDVGVHTFDLAWKRHGLDIRETKMCKDDCDTFTEVSMDSLCCEYVFDVTNVPGTPITHVTYNVISPAMATVHNVSIVGAGSYNTTPASLVNTTAGTLTFNVPTTSNFTVHTHALPNNVTGTSVIEWKTHHTGGMVCTHRDTLICRNNIQPVICDSLSAAPFTVSQLNIDWRTFTIHNIHQPVDNICKIIVDIDPNVNVSGGGLIIDNTSYPWSSPYHVIDVNALGATGASKVEFNIGIDWTLNWTGTVTISVIHCMGDTCDVVYGPWTAQEPTTATISNYNTQNLQITDPLMAVQMKITGSNDITRKAKWISVYKADLEGDIFAVSPAQMNGVANNASEIKLNRVAKGNKVALLEFNEELELNNELVAGTINFIFSDPKGFGDTEDIKWTMYDADGHPIKSGTMVVSGKAVPKAQQALNINEQSEMGMQLMKSVPNPATDATTIHYMLDNSKNIRLEIFNALGNNVMTVKNGHETYGLHQIKVDTHNLTSGSYYIKLTDKDGNVRTQQLMISK